MLRSSWRKKKIHREVKHSDSRTVGQSDSRTENVLLFFCKSAQINLHSKLESKEERTFSINLNVCPYGPSIGINLVLHFVTKSNVNIASSLRNHL